MPNKPAAPNPAIASQLHIGHHWRGVGEPERCCLLAENGVFLLEIAGSGVGFGG